MPTQKPSARIIQIAREETEKYPEHTRLEILVASILEYLDASQEEENENNTNS